MRRKQPLIPLTFLFLVIVAIFGLDIPGMIPGSTPTAPISVHVIDVGQGDSILVLAGDNSLLIDGGNRGDSDLIMAYMHSQGIRKLDAVIATHPHADHIGGLVEIVKEFPLDKIYMPKVVHTSKTYEDLLVNTKNADLKVIAAKPGLTIDLDPGLKAEFLSPAGSSYDSLNNYSAVLKLTYKETSFLFTGDAETKAEEEMLASGADLASTVLKVGHHGSNTSTSPLFLNTVNPEVAVISVGADNSYGHPHGEVIDRLQQAGVSVFRTDLHGTVVITSDGREIAVLTEKQ
jgi:competence protein ComEC